MTGAGLDNTSAAGGPAAADPHTLPARHPEPTVALEGDPELAPLVSKAGGGAILRSNGRKEFVLPWGSRWKPKAASRKSGRGFTGDLVFLDELREHQSWAAWSALSKTTMARPNAQVWCFSNAGDALSVVLRWLRLRAHDLVGDPDGIVAAEDPAALLDDDPGKRRLNVDGLRVTGTREAIAREAERTNSSALIIAASTMQGEDVRDVTERARQAGLDVLIMPPLNEMFHSPRGADLRQLNLEDLLAQFGGAGGGFSGGGFPGGGGYQRQAQPRGGQDQQAEGDASDEPGRHACFEQYEHAHSLANAPCTLMPRVQHHPQRG